MKRLGQLPAVRTLLLAAMRRVTQGETKHGCPAPSPRCEANRWCPLGFSWKVFIVTNYGTIYFIREEKERRRTRGEVLIDWPVVHLQSGVTPVPREAHQVVFAVVDGGARLLHADVHCADVEGHPYFALLL